MENITYMCDHTSYTNVYRMEILQKQDRNPKKKIRSHLNTELLI